MSKIAVTSKAPKQCSSFFTVPVAKVDDPKYDHSLEGQSFQCDLNAGPHDNHESDSGHKDYQGFPKMVRWTSDQETGQVADAPSAPAVAD